MPIDIKRSCSVSIAYAHFPLALLNSHTMTRLLKKVGVSLYVSGHLHGADVQYRTREGVVDLELPSLAYNGIMRLLSVKEGWVAVKDVNVHKFENRLVAMMVEPPVCINQRQ